MFLKTWRDSYALLQNYLFGSLSSLSSLCLETPTETCTDNSVFSPYLLFIVLLSHSLAVVRQDFTFSKAKGRIHNSLGITAWFFLSALVDQLLVKSMVFLERSVSVCAEPPSATKNNVKYNGLFDYVIDSPCCWR